MNARQILLSILFFSLSANPLVWVVPRAHAAGTVYVDPSTQFVLNPGDTFTVTVSISNLDPFNGWDVMVQTDPGVLNVTGVGAVSTSGNVLGNVILVALCINGVGQGCTVGDGPGVVHSADAAFGTPAAHSSGYLFTITYTVLAGTLNYSAISLQKVVISNGSNTPVTVSTTDGTYGSMTPQPDFTITTPITTLTVTQGNAVNATFTLTGLNGIADVVSLDASSLPAGLSFAWNNTAPTVIDGSTVASILTINATNSAPTTQYRVTVTGTPTSSRAHRAYVTVIVQPRGDYLLTLLPSLLKIHATLSGNSTITLSSQRGFSDTLRLGVVSDTAGVVASLNNTSLFLPAGGTANALLTVKTPPANNTFHYTLTVSANATHYQLWSTKQVFITSPTPDIGFTVSPPHLTLKPGDGAQVNVQLTSNDYFKGLVYLVATSISGVKLSYSTTSFPLSYANETFGIGNATVNWVTYGSSTLTVTTDPTIPTGDHSLVVTVISGALSHSITVILTVTRSAGTQDSSNGRLSGQRSILGLEPVTYFGIIAALAVTLVVAAVRELRKPGRGKRRVFLEDDPR